MRIRNYKSMVDLYINQHHIFYYRSSQHLLVLGQMIPLVLRFIDEDNYFG